MCTKSTPYTCCREVHETLLIYLGLMVGMMAVAGAMSLMPRSVWIRLRRSVLFVTGGAVDISSEQPSALEGSLRRRRIVGVDTKDTSTSVTQMARDFHTSWLDQHGLNKDGRDE